jgi:uncharacterized protein (TIGR00255 family)
MTGRRGIAVSVASMTGFARAEGEGAGIVWVWEMKSVNGRSLDIRLRLPPGFDTLEPKLRTTLARRFRRGNFSAALTVTRTAPAAIRINRETLAQLIGLMNELAGEIEAAPPRIDGLLALRGVVERSRTSRMSSSKNAGTRFSTVGGRCSTGWPKPGLKRGLVLPLY